MRRAPPESCFRVLGLRSSASSHEVKAAFRRLARENHPDVNPAATARRRFVEVVTAYRILREKLETHVGDPDWGTCPRCNRDEHLLEALSGGVACAECLLGLTYFRRYLPLPVIVLVKHIAVWALYAAAIVLAMVFVRTHVLSYAGLGFLCSVLGLAVLASEVIWIARRG